MVEGGVGSESPTPLCYKGKQVVSIIATDAVGETVTQSLIHSSWSETSDAAYC